MDIFETNNNYCTIPCMADLGEIDKHAFAYSNMDLAVFKLQSMDKCSSDDSCFHAGPGGQKERVVLCVLVIDTWSSLVFTKN